MRNYFSEKTTFLVLSFISGLLEIGCVIWAISLKFSIPAVLGVGLAYQLGNFVPNPFSIGKKGTLAALVFSVLISFLSFFVLQYIMTFMSVLLFSASLQSLRSSSKSNLPEFTKRVWRVAGFVFSPLLLLSYSMFFLFLAVTLFSMFIYDLKIMPQAFSKAKIGKIGVVMIFHQIHYFSYVYFIPVIFYTCYKTSFYFLGLFVAAGWVVYITVPKIAKGNSYFYYAVTGHLFLTILFPLMAFEMSNTVLFILLWILSGLGGGTVFCIKKINEQKENISSNAMNVAENLGHIGGTVIGLVGFLLTESFMVPFLAASFFAFLTAVSLILYKIKNGVN